MYADSESIILIIIKYFQLHTIQRDKAYKLVNATSAPDYFIIFFRLAQLCPVAFCGITYVNYSCQTLTIPTCPVLLIKINKFKKSSSDFP